MDCYTDYFGKSVDRLTEQGRHELNADLGCTVLGIEYRIDFDNIDRPDLSIRSDQLQQEMGLPVGEAPRHRSSDTGCFAWIETIHVEADMNLRSVGEALECLFRHWSDALFVDLPHCEYGNATGSQQQSLFWVETAQAHDDHVLPEDFRTWSADVDHGGAALACESSEWHAVEIS